MRALAAPDRAASCCSSLRKSAADAIAVEAAALAFSTVLALVPLLAAFLFIGEQVFSEYPAKILNILGEVLPYSEDALITHIRDFLIQAETDPRPRPGRLRAGGADRLFQRRGDAQPHLERRPRRARWRMRAGSLLMVLLWGPLLIGAVSRSSACCASRPGFERVFQSSTFLQSLPFMVTLVGLTMLYWLVPHAPVRFRAALRGRRHRRTAPRSSAARLRRYLKPRPGMSIVYGGFALALIFMTSIHLSWLIALIGSEIAYVEQHFKALRRRGWVPQPPEGRWLALARRGADDRARAARPHADAARVPGEPAGSPQPRAAPRAAAAARGGVLKERKGRKGGLSLAEPAETMQVRRVLEALRRPPPRRAPQPP